MKMVLKVDKYEDKRDEEKGKTLKGIQKHSDSKNRICFQVAYFVFPTWIHIYRTQIKLILHPASLENKGLIREGKVQLLI